MDNTFLREAIEKDRRIDRQCKRATRCKNRRKDLLR